MNQKKTAEFVYRYFNRITHPAILLAGLFLIIMGTQLPAAALPEDPGMDAVEAAGLVTKLDLTAGPTLREDVLFTPPPDDFFLEAPTGAQPAQSSPANFPSGEPPAANPDETSLAVGTESVTMTLDEIYVDEIRLKFRYLIHGLSYTPDAMNLKGNVKIFDANGQELQAFGAGTHTWIEGESGAIDGVWQAQIKKPLVYMNTPLQILLTIDGRSGYESGQTIGSFDPVSGVSQVDPQTYRPNEIPDELVGTFVFSAFTPIYPLRQFNEPMYATANGVTMQLAKVEVTPSTSIHQLCLPEPYAGDWTLGQSGNDEISLQSGKIKTGQWAYTILEYAESSMNSEEAESCFQIIFNLGKTNYPQNYILTIPTLRQAQPQLIPDKSLKNIEEELAKKGIFFEYQGTPFYASDESGIRLTQKPETMSDTEARKEIYKALGYVLEGPWVFPFELP